MKWIYILLFTIIYNYSFGQNDNHPQFETFKGTVYSIPNHLIKKGYGKQVYDYEQIGTVEWDEINIPSRHTNDGFPDVEKKIKFGIILESTMIITEKSCYEFSLNSDDGSKLWINKQIVVDNGGDHGMRLRKDSFQLDTGKYDIKIWYFQAYPNQFGFIFDSKNVGDICNNNKVIDKELVLKKEEIVSSAPKKISFESSILFNTAEYQIKDEAISQLDSLCNIIKKHNPKKIIITGHTDNQGTEKYNLELSQKRANHLQDYLMTTINQIGIQYISRGLGETFPIAENSTKVGREANRRVEIILE